MADNKTPLVETALLRRFRDNPDHRRAIGDGLLTALFDVVTASDANVRYPNSPLGRPTTIDALRRLQWKLEEAYNVVPGVDIPG
jgi:hypothetical protein